MVQNCTIAHGNCFGPIWVCSKIVLTTFRETSLFWTGYGRSFVKTPTCSKEYQASFFLMTMKFHGIPVSKIDGQHGAPRPHRGREFIQAPALSRKKTDPARSRAASPLLPPRSERQPGTQRWDSRRIEQWQQLDPPFSFAPTQFRAGIDKRTAGQWHAGSEARFTRRWMERAACPFQPLSGV